VLFNDALADNTPLWNLVKESITQDVLSAIADEHAKGRISLWEPRIWTRDGR
jgi:hypothetical protein